MSARSEVQTRIRGLYGLADAQASGGDPVALGVAMLEGGCRLVQLRCKGWDPDEVLRAARDLRARCAAALARARALVPAAVPLVAIGGVTAARLEAIRAAGADAWAVIGAIAGAADPVAATRALRGSPKAG